MEEIGRKTPRQAGLGELIDVWARYRELLEMPRDPDDIEEHA